MMFADNLSNSDELRCLVEVSELLQRSLGLKDTLNQTAQIIQRYFRSNKAAISIFSQPGTQMRVECIGEGNISSSVGSVIRVPLPSSTIGESSLGDIEIVGASPEGFSAERAQSLLHVLAVLLARTVQLRTLTAGHRQFLDHETPMADSGVRFHPRNMIGTSKSMQLVYEQIGQVAHSDTSVLILGESGVGKELIAGAIHQSSGRVGKPFIKVNCAALPETLLESELFGHERGSFTGAIQQKKGRFELANGGTLFLDEVGDFTPATQVKLLRVLQEKEFERLGGTATVKSDVRIIAATNRNLEDMISEGRFRQDLYYRLNVFPIHVPPLRERKTDILLLADFFIEKYNSVLNKNVRRISTPVIDMLMSYHWPGNVRELENCIERAVLLSKDDVIHGHQLPPSLQTGDTSGTRLTNTLQGALETLEREMLVESLKTCEGNMARAARELGLSERIIGLRVRKYGIDLRRFKSGSFERGSLHDEVAMPRPTI